MADLHSAFREYYPPTDEQRRTAMTEGLVCLDTNVLLDAYRFAPQAREELLNALEKLGDRLWIPYQVASEFHKNRIKVIGDQASAYTPVFEALDAISEFFNDTVRDKIRTLGRAVALTEGESDEIIKMIPGSIRAAREAIAILQTRHGVSLNMISDDPVLERLEELLKGKVGTPPPPEDEQKAREEAKRRAADNIPPGFADQKKADGSGDYLVWSQILEEAKRRKMSILFVTRDVKEDWFRREKGRTISARPELIQEAKQQADCDLVIMETRQFLFHARGYLNAAVSDELLEQVEKLPTLAVSSGQVVEQWTKINNSEYEAAMQGLTEITSSVQLHEMQYHRQISALEQRKLLPDITAAEMEDIERQIMQQHVRIGMLISQLGELERAKEAALAPIAVDSFGRVYSTKAWQRIETALTWVGRRAAAVAEWKTNSSRIS